MADDGKDRRPGSIVWDNRDGWAVILDAAAD
jgi:hypothetical protein